MYIIIKDKFKLKSHYIFIFLILLFITIYTASYFIDIKNIFGIRDWLLFAIAVSFNGTRDIMYWYQTAGDIIYSFTANLGGEGLVEVYESTNDVKVQNGYMTISYRFMDSLVEESLELMGAGLIFASTISYRNYILNDNKGIGETHD